VFLDPGVATGRGWPASWYEGDNGYVAMVARSRGSIGPAAGSPRSASSSRRTAGPVSNPTGCATSSKAALSRVKPRTREEVTWDDRPGDVDRLADVHSLRLGFAYRRRERAHQPTDAEASGAGERDHRSSPPPIGNAIFDATGAAHRQVPFTPERVKAALGAVARSGEAARSDLVMTKA